MHNELNNRIIDPDYIILVDNDTVLFDKFIIKPFLTNEGLSIKLNDNLIKTYEFKTLNQAENGFVELSFASNLKKVKYYKNDKWNPIEIYLIKGDVDKFYEKLTAKTIKLTKSTIINLYN